MHAIEAFYAIGQIPTDYKTWLNSIKRVVMPE